MHLFKLPRNFMYFHITLCSLLLSSFHCNLRMIVKYIFHIHFREKVKILTQNSTKKG